MLGIGVGSFAAMYVSAWTIVRIVAIGYALFTLARFLRADADLSLMHKGHPPPHFFEDEVVWITGASQGLGEVLAKYFAAQGARLVISARRAGELEVRIRIARTTISFTLAATVEIAFVI